MGTIVAAVKRNGRVIVPRGGTQLQEGDKVIMYTQQHFSHEHRFEV